FLNNCVGKNWNNVFKEICEHIDLNSTVKKHVRDHVDGIVAIKVLIENGKVYSADRLPHYELFKNQLYVDPASGILKRYTNSTRRNYYCCTKPTYSCIEEEMAWLFGKLVVNAKAVKLEFRSGILWRVNQDKSGDFTIYNEATAQHAKYDYNGFYIKDTPFFT